MSTQLYPAVIDDSALRPRLTQEIFLPIGIEGLADTAGTAVLGTLYRVSREDEANTLFGTSSILGTLVKQVLKGGAGPVIAVASQKGVTAPTLAERQTQWEKLAADETIRIRLTGSDTQADLVALGASCEDANVLGNKQFGVVGLPAGTTKANLIAAGTAIRGGTGTGTRMVVVAPGVYDQDGTLQSGRMAAAVVAAEIAKNSDPSIDLDLYNLPFLTAIEKSADGLPLLRRRVSAGVETNDHEDLLQAGISTLMPSRDIAGGVMVTHLRMAASGGQWDSLQTRIIVDQVFLDVKNYILDGGFLRQGNTDVVRTRIRSGVVALLDERRTWLKPVAQSDGTTGYNVTVTSSADNRQVTISYEGTVVRGISTVKVAANLTIPV